MPKTIGRYQIANEVGRGGMGVVYLARDPFIDRDVAIKTTLTPPPSDAGEFEVYKSVFFNEARTAGKLTHRNIVQMFDAHVDRESSYLVMEYVDGPNLSKYTSKNSLLPLGKVINAAFQCAKALDYAHQQGVIHRDIKPSNILLSSLGVAKISDFGIAVFQDTEKKTSGMNLTGSLMYASPEQLRKENVTPQSDLYSLGVLLFELVAGERPFEADSDVALFYQVTSEEPKKLKSVRSDVPESLERIVARCLEKDLNRRYANGGQVAQELIASFDHLRNITQEINQEEKLNSLKKISFFKDFSSSELAEVVKDTSWVRHAASSTIIAEGEMDDSFYILVSGEVVVRKKGQILAMLKPGDCFGEMAYLGNTRRTASILAATDTVLMRMSASILDRMSMSAQLMFYRVFSKTLISRLARTSEILSKIGY
jgi:serine/threonine protein kinase